MKAFLYYNSVGIDIEQLLQMTASEFAGSLPAHNYRGFLQPWMYERPKHLDVLEVSAQVSTGFCGHSWLKECPNHRFLIKILWKSIDFSTSAIPGSFGWLRGRFGGAKVLYCLHLRRKISIQYSTFVVRRRKSAVLSAFEAQN